MTKSKCGCGRTELKKDAPSSPIPIGGAVGASGGGTVTTALLPVVPIAKATRFGLLAASIVSAVPVGATLTVRAYRNGVAVPGAEIVFGGSSPAVGTQHVRFSQSFSADDLLTVQATQTGVFPGAIFVSASVTPFVDV